MRRAALYLRVSRQDQTEANQLPDLKRLARQRGLRIVATYSERASASVIRPKFEAMREAAHDGQFDCVLVWALDRLGRSLLDNVRTVLELEHAGVEVVSVREPWLQTAGPVRDLLLAIFSWVAQQEKNQIVERTRAGLARARRAGAKFGRPKRMTPAMLARARELKAKGKPIRLIAQMVNAPRSTVARALSHNSPPKRAIARPQKRRAA